MNKKTKPGKIKSVSSLKNMKQSAIQKNLQRYVRTKT